jgi:hypothetical protein
MARAENGGRNGTQTSVTSAFQSYIPMKFHGIFGERRMNWHLSISCVRQRDQYSDEIPWLMPEKADAGIFHPQMYPPIRSIFHLFYSVRADARSFKLWMRPPIAFTFYKYHKKQASGVRPSRVTLCCG